MKNLALLCFILVASACVLVARADEETPAVDAPKMEDQPETADVMADEEQTEADKAETENDEVDTENDEEDTDADDAQEDEEVEEDEEETTDIADDEPEKRGWVCRRYRKGKLRCKACGCRRICKPKFCIRRVCKRVRCTRKVCRIVIRFKIVRYKYRNPYYKGYGSLYLWKTKKVPYKVRICKNVPSFCTKCYNQRYNCGRVCRNVCKYRKCSLYG
ncbi:Hypothetical predicted protein [Paramuricea clavata]|uniref:Uncharacterized protein n=1 Tax=Paramuricea clavata TaxID=317549 RepID=A0A7D9ECR4_PARCT|nr:Hypothetical predicted protein [Paramuricea clavata]